MVGVVSLLGLALLHHQAERIRQDYWIRDLHWRTVWGTFSEFLVPTHGVDCERVGQVVFAVTMVSCLAATISGVQPIWVARDFRFAHLFVLTAVALAAWHVSRWWLPLKFVLLALFFAVLLSANVVF